MVNGQLVVTAAAGALTVAVKTLAGADPSAGSPVVFRIPNASGTYDSINVTSALSLVVPIGANARRRLPALRSACGWSRSTMAARSCLVSAACRGSSSAHVTSCPLADSAAGRNSTLLNTASDGFGIHLFKPGDVEQADARARLHRMGSRPVLPRSARGPQRIFVACNSWGSAFACPVNWCKRLSSATAIQRYGPAVRR